MVYSHDVVLTRKGMTLVRAIIEMVCILLNAIAPHQGMM